MKFTKLGLMTVLMMALSACSQSRMGLGGRFENVYLLQPVELQGPRGVFVVEVNMTDNEAYLFAKDMTQAVASQSLRLLAKASGKNGYDVLNASFRLDPTNSNEYLVVRPRSGVLITDYTHWYIETTTKSGLDVGLSPVAADVGKGDLVVHAEMYYPDLEAALHAMGYYTLAQ